MRSSLPTRRGFLNLASAGVLGWSLPQCLALTAQAAGKHKARAKNVLVILEQGGLSHIDTWDPKPDVLSDYRSPYRPVATNVPGMQFTELLAKTAVHADKLAVIRSMYHPRPGADAHPSGTRYILSGNHPGGALEMPDIGSVAAHLIGSECKYLPPYIMVPGNDEQAAEAKPGFLPAATRVFKTGGKDVSDPSWRIDALRPREENSSDRFAARQRLASQLDRRSSADTPREISGMDRFYEQAFTLLGSPQVTKAFDVQGEPAAVRQRYGAGHRGACYLVGRKLIEAGARFVTVDVRWPLSSNTPRGTNLNWDHHDHIYAKESCELPGAGGGGAGRYGIGHWCMMGSTDQAFSALLDDLHQRGLLAETLVCFVTEFGRTPRINKHQGRDHWARAYSIALAGAGVRGGQVIGRTDKEGGAVTDQPYCPEDYAATVYDFLGIDRAQPVYTASHRPVFFGHTGKPIAEVL